MNLSHNIAKSGSSTRMKSIVSVQNSHKLVKLFRFLLRESRLIPVLLAAGRLEVQALEEVLRLPPALLVLAQVKILARVPVHTLHMQGWHHQHRGTTTLTTEIVNAVSLANEVVTKSGIWGCVIGI